jgi:ribosomal protein L11 methyltransferase
MVELFPGGFEEIDHPDGVELVAYTDASGEERMWHAFGQAASAEVSEGWEERWREFHKPARVGPLWIGPPWIDPPADATAVVIEPARAFGTGAHPTTRLVVELLLEVDRGAVLDVGCGSGVLSIAAAKLGFAPVVALDIEDAAVDAARANAAANGVDIDVSRSDATTAELPSADLALANITRELVELVAPRLHCPQLIASGYLVSDEPSLDGYNHQRRVMSEGWAADLFARQ